MLRPDWTLRKAIEEQVRLEDMVAWAERPTPEFKIVPPAPQPPQPSKALMRHLLYQWLP